MEGFIFRNVFDYFIILFNTFHIYLHLFILLNRRNFRERYIHERNFRERNFRERNFREFWANSRKIISQKTLNLSFAKVYPREIFQIRSFSKVYPVPCFHFFAFSNRFLLFVFWAVRFSKKLGRFSTATSLYFYKMIL